MTSGLMGTSRLMGMAEIRARLGGISRQRVYQLVTRPDFPEPYDRLAQGNVWRREDVDSWVTANRHEPQTPPG